MITVEFLKINRGTIIAKMEMDYIVRMDEVIVLSGKGYIVRGIHHIIDDHKIQVLLDDYPYLYTKA